MKAAARAIECLGACLVGGGVLFGGCVPNVGVTIAREGSAIVFSISECPVSWHQLPVTEISVFKAGNRDQEPECHLIARRNTDTVLRHWTYGTAPDGFRLERCAPLLEDVAYTAQVYAVGFGERSFTLRRGEKVSQEPRFACW